MTEPGQVLDDRYRLDARIAAGGMGEVWRGTDLALSRAVAVKLLHPEQASAADGLARFRAEAQHAGRLSHPNIAQVYDYCEPAPPGPAYLVMELVDGPSLARQLDGGPIAPERTLDVIEQAASGLAAAHRSGLLHRDIKPGNLLLSRDGLVKITDFGIARLAGSPVQTRTGALTGTPAYLAPERVSGAPATPAADLYALGVVAYQCLTGQVPFAGEPLVVALAQVEREMPALPAAVPGPLADLVADLTRKDPGARPASAIAVLARAGLVRAALSGTAPTGISPVSTAPTGIGPLSAAAAETSLAGTSTTGTSAAASTAAGHTAAMNSPAEDSADGDSAAANPAESTRTSSGAISATRTSFAGTSALDGAAGQPADPNGRAGHQLPGRHAPRWAASRRAVLVLGGLAAAGLASVAIWLLTSGAGAGPAGHGAPSQAPAAQQASPRHSTGPHPAAAARHGHADQPRGHKTAAQAGAGHRRQPRRGPAPTQPAPTVSSATPSAAPTPTTPAASPTASTPAPTPSASVSGNGSALAGGRAG